METATNGHYPRVKPSLASVFGGLLEHSPSLLSSHPFGFISDQPLALAPVIKFCSILKQMFLCYLLGSLLYSIEVTSKYRKCNVSLSYERYIKTFLCYAAWKNQNTAADTVRLLPWSNIDCVFFSFFVHLFAVS